MKMIKNIVAVFLCVLVSSCDALLFNPDRASENQSSIDILRPTEGESVIAGSVYSISWEPTSSDVSGYYTIKLYLDGNLQNSIVTYYYSSSTVPSYSWSVPLDIDPSSQYSIRISDSDDSSIKGWSSNFTISAPTITVTYPNGGQTFRHGDQIDINWDFSSETNLRIKLYDGSQSVYLIKSYIGSTNGPYSWAIPSSIPAGSSYKIRIELYNDNTIYDESDYSFTIEEEQNDLAISNVYTSNPNINDGGYAYIYFTTTTSDVIDSADISVTYYISSSSSSYQGGISLGTYGFGSDIPSGTNNWLESSVYVPNSFTNGTYYLWVVANYSDSNQSNNSDSYQVYIY